MDYAIFLKQQFGNNRLHHAYAVVGKYCDKEKFLDYIIGLIGVFPEDITRVESTGNISINDLKKIKKELNFLPFNSPRKIVIITPADAMTIEAQNALLKILEEPADKSIVLLMVNNEDRILPTIYSRCQIIRLMSKKIFEVGLPDGLKDGSWNALQRFEFVSDLIENENLHEILDGWLVELSRLLVKNPKEKKWGYLIDRLNETINMLRSNINVKLALENLVLKF